MLTTSLALNNRAQVYTMRSHSLPWAHMSNSKTSRASTHLVSWCQGQLWIVNGATLFCIVFCYKISKGKFLVRFVHYTLKYVPYLPKYSDTLREIDTFSDHWKPCLLYLEKGVIWGKGKSTKWRQSPSLPSNEECRINATVIWNPTPPYGAGE